MASIYALPIELLQRVVDLLEEDFVALNEEQSRRNMLLNLSLVSKQFIRPAQEVLWRRLNDKDLAKGDIMNLLRHGFAKNIVVQELSLDY